MMDLQKLADTLHPLERKVLPYLSTCTTAQELEKNAGLQEVEVIRALQWLQNKGIITLKTALVERVSLDRLGKKYAAEGLPEQRFLKTLTKQLALEQIKQLTKLDQNELSAALGVLRKQGAVEFKDKKLTVTKQWEKLLAGSTEEKLLEKLSSGPVELKTLSSTERAAYDRLKSRKDILLAKSDKATSFQITFLGKTLTTVKLKTNVIDQLTPDLLKGAWKGKSFRRYDISAQVPRINFGRRQHYRAFLDDIRRKFTTLGFKEMNGPIVESDFWDMDALFMPQFHSARDIHEAYYIQEPEYADLDKNIVKKVKSAHEAGYNTGSKGWRYIFDEKRTSRQLLRTQGTACSARMLASKDLKIPGKYFGITKCFRYDVIDATHLPDFYQTEGIVAEEGLNFTHLKGLLKLFAEEFAKSDTIKIRPAYFPFTEPSAELFAKHPDLGWIELGGAGVFRPELTAPLGVNVPVIAWGMGIDRIGMFNLGIKDIRDLYSHDLHVLRNARVTF